MKLNLIKLTPQYRSGKANIALSVSKNGVLYVNKETIKSLVNKIAPQFAIVSVDEKERAIGVEFTNVFEPGCRKVRPERLGFSVDIGFALGYFIYKNNLVILCKSLK